VDRAVTRGVAAAERDRRDEWNPHAARKSRGRLRPVGRPAGPCQYPPSLL